LAGTLNVSLLNSFNPAIGNSFQILNLNWANTTGTFATLQLPTISGGATWDTSKLYVNGTISVVGIIGDFSHNGRVDAADYDVWRDSLGKTGPNLAADCTGINNGVLTGVPDGIVDQNDYNYWTAHFGQVAPGSGAGSGSAAGVPEPASIILFAMAATTLLVSRIWRSRTS
jgi:hypothetical protein